MRRILKSVWVLADSLDRNPTYAWQTRPRPKQPFFGMVQFRVAASSAAWGWQGSKSGATIPPLGEAATPYGATNSATRNLTYLNHVLFSFILGP